LKKYTISVIAVVGYLLIGCGSSQPTIPTGVTGGRYTPQDCQNKPDAIFDPKRAADKLVVDKSEHTMYVYKNGKVIRTLPVSIGPNPGPKIQQGDRRTPEGTYRILDKRCHPIKYRAMTISYPNAKDRARARKLGVNPGSMITIHGQPHWNADGHGDDYTLSHDWTNGCIALTNRDLDWLWGSVRVGTPITIHE
jgi:murein L,D-transpeptidase YafK